MFDFEQFLRHAWPPSDWADLTIVVAVSGGPDSVALLHGLVRVRQAGPGRLVVAHFNHALRPDAQEDEAFVCDLAASLGLPCRVGTPSTSDSAALHAGQSPRCATGPRQRPPKALPQDARPQAALPEQSAHGGPHGSPPPPPAGAPTARPAMPRSEALSRAARYAFLRCTAEDCGARFVVTAHTADDQVETILHRIVRGTGLTGLMGMPRVRRLGAEVSLLRPLLDCTRRDILDYLAQRNLPYREDPTNRDRRFTRNRIRHELLPLLRSQFNPRVDEALRRLAAQAREAQSCLLDWADRLAEQAIRHSDEALRLDVGLLAGQPQHLVCEVLRQAWRQQRWPQRAMHQHHWRRLAHLVLQGGRTVPGRKTRLMLPSHVQCTWEDDRTLVLRRTQSQ